MKRFVFAAIAALVGLAVLQACSGDYQRKLPNGYKLIRANSDTIVIMRSEAHRYMLSPTGVGGMAIGVKIDKYCVVGDYVVGYVIASPSGIRDSETEGYFLLDTKDGALAAGLDRASWKGKLAHAGIRLDRLRLRSPSSLW